MRAMLALRLSSSTWLRAAESARAVMSSCASSPSLIRPGGLCRRGIEAGCPWTSAGALAGDLGHGGEVTVGVAAREEPLEAEITYVSVELRLGFAPAEYGRSPGLRSKACAMARLRGLAAVCGLGGIASWPCRWDPPLRSEPDSPLRSEPDPGRAEPAFRGGEPLGFRGDFAPPFRSRLSSSSGRTYSAYARSMTRCSSPGDGGGRHAIASSTAAAAGGEAIASASERVANELFAPR